MKFLLLILCPIPAFSVCRLEEGISRARPGAQWVMNDSSYENLVWMDKTQTKPTLLEIQNAVTTCRNEEAIRLQSKDAARFAVKSSTMTTDQKLNALILLLDLDK